MSRCIKCQAELTASDVERGLCPKCKTHVMQGTVEIPDTPDYSLDQPVVLSSIADSAEGLGANTANVPSPSADSTKGSSAAPQKVGKASVPAAPALSVEDIFNDTNTRQSINPDNFPRNQRNVMTSLMLGESAHAMTEDFTDSVDKFDTSLDEPIIGPMDRSVDTASLPRSREISVFEGREKGPDDESLSSWQGRSGLGAESNLVIQQRSVLTSPNEPQGAARSDYQLVDLIGKGGMGTVWKARQYSIGRTVAVKMIRAEKAHDKEARERFLSEAVITGDLDHPNIVPVHDLGKFESNELFYSMRRVGGQPWDKVMFEKTLAENLEIWNKVCDAIAFAHSRGIVHRDIKPENVMVGDYGEVLVMDWGLALPLPNFPKYTMIMPPTRSGGSPAYMAPEMVGLLLDQVGPWSDIYLLGATLYEIVTGNPPHPGRTVSECVSNAKNNVIQPFAQGGKKSELVNISLKAMASKPDDRYGSVLELQAAVKRYAEHQESLTLAENASVAVARGQEFKDYKEFARAVFGYEEALNRWDGNRTAHEGLNQARLTYAETALANHDYDLGLSLLDAKNAQHATVVQKLKSGKNEREARTQRIKNQQRMMAALVAFIGLAGLGAGGFFYMQNNKLNAANTKLVAASETEKRLTKQAQDNEKRALNSEADAKRALAAETKALNDLTQKQAQLDTANKNLTTANDTLKTTNTQLAMAKTSLETSLMETKKAKEAADVAAMKEKEAADAARLARDAAQESEKKALAAAEAEKEQRLIAAITAAGEQVRSNSFTAALATLDDLKDPKYADLLAGKYKAAYADLSKQVERRSFAVDGNTALKTVAVAPGGKLFASGSQDGRIRFWTLNAQDNPEARGDLTFKSEGKLTVPVTSLAFSADGKWLAVCGGSKVVRVWNVENVDAPREGPELVHEDHVTALRFAPTGTTLVTSDAEKLRIWDVAGGKELSPARSVTGVVHDIAFSSDGQTLLVGGDARMISAWTRRGNALEQISQFTGSGAAVNAVAISADGQTGASGHADGMVLVWRMQDLLAARSATATQSVNIAFSRLPQHTAAVTSLAFSASGENLVSGSEDNTMGVWDVARKALSGQLRGHGNSVNDVAFLAGSSVVSVSGDSTIRVWDVKLATAQNNAPVAPRSQVGKADVKAHDGDVSAAALNADGKKVVTAALDRTAILWDTTNGNRLMTFKEGHDYLADRAFLIDGGKKLITAAQDQSLCVWDVVRGVELQRVKMVGVGDAVAVSPDGKSLVTSSDAQALLVWDIDTLLKAPKGQAKPAGRIPLSATATSAAYSADGTKVAVTTDADTVKVCDVAGRKVITTSPILPDEPEIDDVVSLVFAGENRLVIAGTEGSAFVWTIGEAKPSKVLAHDHSLVTLTLSGDGQRLAVLGRAENSASTVPQVTVWDLAKALDEESPTPAATFGVELEKVGKDEVGAITAVSLSQDGQTLVTASTTPTQQRVLRWSLIGGAPRELPLSANDRGTALGALVLPDASGVVTVGSNEARLWTWGDTPAVKQYYRPHRLVTAAGLSPDASLVATGDQAGTIKVWDAATGLCLQRIEAHPDSINGLTFSPKDNSLLLSASDDRTAILWKWDANAASLAKVGALDDAQKGHKGPVTRARFSNDGQSIVTACEDGTVRVWDAAARTITASFAYENPVAFVAADILPDGSAVVFADSTRVQILDVKTGKTMLAQPITGHGREVTDVRFLDSTPERLRILTSSLDGTGKIWEVTTGGEASSTELLTLGQRGRTAGVTALAATPSGDAIVTGHADGRRFVWRAPAEVAQ